MGTQSRDLLLQARPGLEEQLESEDCESWAATTPAEPSWRGFDILECDWT